MKTSILLLSLIFASFSNALAADPSWYLIQNGRPGTVEREMNAIVVSPVNENLTFRVQIQNGLYAYRDGIKAHYSSQTQRYEFKSDVNLGEDCPYFGCKGIDSFSGYITNEKDRVVLTVRFFEDDGEPELKYYTETSTYLLKSF
jgi:hypothetical protein